MGYSNKQELSIKLRKLKQNYILGKSTPVKLCARTAIYTVPMYLFTRLYDRLAKSKVQV